MSKHIPDPKDDDNLRPEVQEALRVLGKAVELSHRFPKYRFRVKQNEGQSDEQ